MEVSVASLERERDQLALLLQIARRYLEHATRDPIDTLFSYLHRAVAFESAFVALSGVHGARYVTHPSGETLGPEDCLRVHRDAQTNVCVVLDGPEDSLTVGERTYGSRALLSISDGSCIVLLASAPGAFSDLRDFLEVLADIHASACRAVPAGSLRRLG